MPAFAHSIPRLHNRLIVGHYNVARVICFSLALMSTIFYRRLHLSSITLRGVLLCCDLWYTITSFAATNTILSMLRERKKEMQSSKSRWRITVVKRIIDPGMGLSVSGFTITLINSLYIRWNKNVPGLFPKIQKCSFIVTIVVIAAS